MIKHLEQLHNELVEKKRKKALETKPNGFATLHNHYNAMVVENIRPTELLDCNSKTNMDNFMHIINGDKLVYAELLNSVTFRKDGKGVSKSFVPLLSEMFYENTLYDYDLLTQMSKSIVGKNTLYERIIRLGCTDFKIGKASSVQESDILDLSFNGRKYGVLCVLFWMKDKIETNFSRRKQPLFWCSTVVKVDAKCIKDEEYPKNKKFRVYKSKVLDVWMMDNSDSPVYYMDWYYDWKFRRKKEFRKLMI